MKCLVLAARKGSRLWQRGNSKPLIPLLGIPLIERTIRSALEAGIDDFYVVSGYNGGQVRRFLEDLAPRCATTITHVINNDWQNGNGLSVLAAKEHLAEPFVLLMADHLFDPSILRDLAVRRRNHTCRRLQHRQPACGSGRRHPGSKQKQTIDRDWQAARKI